MLARNKIGRMLRDTTMISSREKRTRYFESSFGRARAHSLTHMLRKRVAYEIEYRTLDFPDEELEAGDSLPTSHSVKA